MLDSILGLILDFHAVEDSASVMMIAMAHRGDLPEACQTTRLPTPLVP